MPWAGLFRVADQQVNRTCASLKGRCWGNAAVGAVLLSSRPRFSPVLLNTIPGLSLDDMAAKAGGVRHSPLLPHDRSATTECVKGKHLHQNRMSQWVCSFS